MKQVVQNYRTGQLFVDDVPAPAALAGGVLVRTVCSAVSAGTERSKVELARKSLVGKALSRPDQVRKVIDTVRREGVAAAYAKVVNKLESLAPLGYSTAGIVVAVGAGCEHLAVGDAVACAGAGYANHAELAWVPRNLVARVPDGVPHEQAAFATIGAIALQGVRQADVRLGEVVAVVGLGLLGQLAVQLLKASGCRVVGVDVDPWKVELARRVGADRALVRSDDVAGHVGALSGGRGADAVLVTAAADTNDPFVLAGEIARDRAHVVLVGAVPIEIPRSPYYEKELDVRLSRSYGPGRYDPAYEEHGQDYPAGYVRWTEGRNLEAVLGAMASRQLALEPLITHRFALDDAERAYDLLSGGGERFLGIVLRYGEAANGAAAEGGEAAGGGAAGGGAAGGGAAGGRAAGARVATAPGAAEGRAGARVRVGLIGAGSFAGGTLLPVLKDLDDVSLVGVCTASGLTARSVALRHGFAYAAGDADEILRDPAVNAVVIATRHASHAELAARALEAGKAVFVEKPLALTREELARVAVAAAGNDRLLVGFNRRFSPHTARARSHFAGRAGALVVTIRVNAGAIPRSSWIHDPAVGGGRILGEACHFVDLAAALVGAPPVRVGAVATGAAGGDEVRVALRDNVAIELGFADGSIASIVYTSSGHGGLAKERVEVHGDGRSAVIDDFRETTLHGRRPERFRTTQDKGHREELRRFVAMAARSGPPPVPFAELAASTRATLAVLEALATGGPVALP